MKTKRCLSLAVLLAVLLLCLAGCQKKERTATIRSLSDLHDPNLIMAQPSDFNLDEALEEACGRTDKVYYDSEAVGLSAVAGGKADAFFLGKSYVEEAERAGTMDGLMALETPLTTFYCGLGLSEFCTVENYQERVNEAIQTLMDDGTLDEMKNRWFVEKNEEMPELPKAENPETTLRVVTFGQAKPYSFYRDNTLSGFDVELAYRIAAMLNCELTLDAAEYPAMLMGLSTGKYDMISANLYITEERGDNILYSDSYDSMDIVAVVRAEKESSVSVGAVLSSIQNSFYKTFVTDSRWKTLVGGFETTAVITAFGFLFANVLGAGYCALSMSGKKVLRGIAEVYARIMQGTPITVVLLILCFVIFGNSNISGVLIAIIGFALDSGVALGQLFLGGLTGVAAGQKEAALALGCTRLRTFTDIVFPQTVRRILPSYFSALISLMKATSIVGYVAVVDLTKAGNIIQATTYEAFFPLLSVAAIYFLLSTVLLNLAKRLQKKLLPKRSDKKEGEQ